VDGLLNGKRYLIHDRDPLFTAGVQSFDEPQSIFRTLRGRKLSTLGFRPNVRSRSRMRAGFRERAHPFLYRGSPRFDPDWLHQGASEGRPCCCGKRVRR
jgi:hypothetical protein